MLAKVLGAFRTGEGWFVASRLAPAHVPKDARAEEPPGGPTWSTAVSANADKWGDAETSLPPGMQPSDGRCTLQPWRFLRAWPPSSSLGRHIMSEGLQIQSASPI